MDESASIEDLGKKIDELMEKIKDFEDEKRDIVGELIESIEEFTKAGLVKIVRTLKKDPHGKELLLEMVREPEVYALFLKHKIIKEDDRVRAIKALELIKPYIRSHGGDVEFVDIREDTLYVKLKGACLGCSQVSFTLQQTILEAVQAYVPRIKKVELYKDSPVEAFVDLNSESDDYVKAFKLEDLQEGKIYRFSEGNIDAVVVIWNGNVYAYRNSCAHQGAPLHDGYITEEGNIVCPFHGFQYSVLSGECITVPYIQLEPIYVKVKEGYVWLKP